MRKFIYITASVLLLGGLLAGSVVVHVRNVRAQTVKAANAAQNLAIVKQVDAKNLENAVNSQKQADTAQFNADQKALCTFIAQHVPKGTVIPSECTASPL